MNQKNTFLTAIILISLFTVTLSVNATPELREDELLNPGTTPDSPLYFLKTWKESIQTFFIFGLENKARQYLHLAEVRLAEYQKMIDKGKTKIAEKTLAKYEKQLNRALEKAETMKQKGKETKDLTQNLEQTVSRHLNALQKNLEKSPEAAKKGIEKAIESSDKAIEKIAGKLKQDQTVGWKTYRNEQYGFEVKYPPILKVWENQQSGKAIYAVSFENLLADRTTAGRKIVFNVSIFNNATQLQDAFSANSDPYRLRIVQGEATVGEYQAHKILFKPNDTKDIEATVYLIEDRSTAIIIFGTDYHKISEADMSQILPTFRFISQ